MQARTSKPMEGVDIVDELLDGIIDAAAGGGAQEEEEQKSIEKKERLPAPEIQWPA